MDYKKVYKTAVELLVHPARAWWHIMHRVSKEGMMGDFLYPMVMLCGTALFLGRILSNGLGWTSLYSSLVDASLRSISLLFAYYALSFLVALFTDRYIGREADRELTDVFTGYSMVVVLVLEICMGLFPEFGILAFIAQFYTLKVVWDGAVVLIKVSEERRFVYTMVVSILLMVVPVVVCRLIGMLSIALS